VNTYTAHIAEGRPPVLVREGFAWGAFLLGPLWLLWHRAWIALVLVLCLDALIPLRAPHLLHAPLALILAAALGVFGNDIRRASLARAGYVEAHVLAARGQEAAYARLLAGRPDIAAAAAS
jgi:hypothetical protein